MATESYIKKHKINKELCRKFYYSSIENKVVGYITFWSSVYAEHGDTVAIFKLSVEPQEEIK